MKTRKTLLILIAFFILNIITSEAGFFEISPECQEENCISGQNINWNIKFENIGQKEIKVIGIELIESINQSEIASLIFEYDPSKSDKLECLTVFPGKKETIHIKSKIPLPNLKNQLIYMPCITTVIPTTAAQYVDSYTDRVCYPNESITVFECLTDKHCKINELCQNKKCKQIICEDCQYILNKKCINYQCCSSDACNLDESCINHKCIILNCSPEEIILNNSCAKLECDYDEYIVNHICVKLECEDHEGYANHSCANLECSYDEHIINHSCAKLECGFFEKIDINKCIIDRQFTAKVAIELIITISIIYLLVLDIKKRKSRYKKYFS